jgi:type I restriction enzyme S subunit
MSSVVPDGWSEDYISEYFDFSIGGTPSRNNELYWDANQTTSNIWVSIRDLKDKFISNSAERISELGVSKSNVKLLPKGTVLMSFKLSIGRLSISMTPLYTNEAIVGFIEKRPNTVDRDYLYYGLQSWNLLGEVDQAVKGATLNKDKMSRILGIFPPLPEQKKIASILTSVDEVIENTQKQINKLQDLKKATMSELLTKGIGHTEFKDSELGRIPKSWEVVSLGECFNLTSGKSKPKRLLSSVKTQLSKVPVYGGNGVTGYTDSELLDEQTIVIGRVGEYCGCVHLTPKLCWITDNALYIKSITRVFDLSFMFHLMVFSDLAQLQSKGGQPLVSQKPICEYVIALPPIVEQQKIASFIDAISSNIDNQSVKLHQTQSLKKSLMQDLLTGKVRVTVN